MSRLLAELKRRNVIRMAGLYLVVSWLVVQVAETVLPVFEVPAWVLRAIIIVLALGFVPALVFSWIFELTPEGLKRDEQVDPAQSIAPQTARRMDRLLALGLVAVVAIVAADRYWPSATDRSEPAPAPTVVASQSGDTPDATAAAVSPARSEQGSDGQASIAVLPFANLSSDPEQAYFSDGMTELLNVLARIPGLKVAARTSVFEFKDRGGDVREIGSKLGVSHVIEGSVRREGQQIRVTAQLIRVADGFHVWSESYDRKLEGIFALQDELARRIGESLEASFGLDAAAEPRTPVATEAYDAYLRGRALLRNRSEIQTAIGHFQAAVEREPDFAAAWSSLSLSYDVGYWYIPDQSPAQLAELVVNQAEAAERAAALEPDSAAVQHALGNLARKQFRYAESEQRNLRAMEIDPGYPDVREDYAELLFGVGRTSESRILARQLVQLDPYFGIGWVRVFESAVHFDDRREVDEAIEHVRVLMPDNSLGPFAYSTSCRSPIPSHAGHPFHVMPVTDSTACRSG